MTAARESFAFTEIDRSLAVGASLKGNDWGRADDTIGVGVAVNALSSEHRDYLAAGGYGLHHRRRQAEITAASST